MRYNGNLGCPGMYYESGIVNPIPIKYLITQVTLHPKEFEKCFLVETLEKAVEKLNKNNCIYGKYYLNNGHIYGKIDSKIIRI